MESTAYERRKFALPAKDIGWGHDNRYLLVFDIRYS